VEFDIWCEMHNVRVGGRPIAGAIDIRRWTIDTGEMLCDGWTPEHQCQTTWKVRVES
jgi:hypothetical protein